MQTSLIVLAVVLLGLAGIYFHFGFRNPSALGTSRAQAAFLIFAVLLFPQVVATLLLQSTAQTRLAGLGLQPPHQLSSAVGIAVGIGRDPVWVFEVDGSAQSVIAYFSQPEAHPGWRLLVNSPSHLELERGNQRLTIGASQNGWGETVSILLRSSPSTVTTN